MQHHAGFSKGQNTRADRFRSSLSPCRSVRREFKSENHLLFSDRFKDAHKRVKGLFHPTAAPSSPLPRLYRSISPHLTPHTFALLTLWQQQLVPAVVHPTQCSHCDKCQLVECYTLIHFRVIMFSNKSISYTCYLLLQQKISVAQQLRISCDENKCGSGWRSTGNSWEAGKLWRKEKKKKGDAVNLNEGEQMNVV